MRSLNAAPLYRVSPVWVSSLRSRLGVSQRTPRLPVVSPLSEGGAKQFREMSRKSSRQSTFGRASSKMEVGES